MFNCHRVEQGVEAQVQETTTHHTVERMSFKPAIVDIWQILVAGTGTRVSLRGIIAEVRLNSIRRTFCH